jgi:hypothetical protein
MIRCNQYKVGHVLRLDERRVPEMVSVGGERPFNWSGKEQHKSERTSISMFREGGRYNCASASSG